jgi:hypothetical protein
LGFLGHQRGLGGRGLGGVLECVAWHVPSLPLIQIDQYLRLVAYFLAVSKPYSKNMQSMFALTAAGS